MKSTVSERIKSLLENPNVGAIRKMFEDGAALKAKYGAENVFDFSLGNPDLEPPSELVNAVKETALSTLAGRHGYMQNSGYEQTRKAMAEKTSLEQEVKVDFSNIIMSCGAAGAINTVLKAVLNPDDEVIVPCPYFAEYDHYIANHGGIIRCVKTKDDFSLDIEAIKSSCTPKTAAIIINSPNNPTGRVYTKDEIRSLADALHEMQDKCGRLPFIISDEPYRAIVYDGKKVSPIFPIYENAAVVTSFAKNLSIPGERIGYIAINPACTEAAKLTEACTFCTRILGYVNAPAFFQKVIAKSWNAQCDYSPYKKRRNLIMSVMDYAGLQYQIPDGAFYLFVKVPARWNGDDIAFTSHLKQFNILCVPGTSFGTSGWFRIAFCVPENTILNSKEAFYKAVHSK
ncbi:MAG: pyridoxal phosphate-dependent aminotransferase [Treponema sp.]